MGEVDVVEVVASTPCDGEEVFDGATHWVTCRQVGVDGFGAEDALTASRFPFSLDELYCGISFEFGGCPAARAFGCFFWIVSHPPPEARRLCFSVGGPVSFGFRPRFLWVSFAPALGAGAFEVWVFSCSTPFVGFGVFFAPFAHEFPVGLAFDDRPAFVGAVFR